MKTLISMITLGTLGLALALPAGAAEKAGKGPCAEDAAKFCKGVEPGGGRVAACLKEHEKQLSQACVEKRAKAAEKRKHRKEAFGRLEKRGGGAGLCQREYGQGFGAGFQRGFRMAGKFGAKGKAAKAKKAGLGKVCKADIEKVCGDVKPGEGRVRDCLIRNADKLGEGCKTRVEKARGRLLEKGKKV